MTNYSKWDKFAADLSDSDSEETGPEITTFDDEGGKSIEIGPQGYKIKESPVETCSRVEVLSSSSVVDEKDLINESKNGAVCDGYSWSQDRYEVILSIPIAESVKAKDIRLTFAEKILSIRTTDRTMLLNGTLRYDAMTNAERKDDEVSDILDWEIKNKIISKSNSDTKQTTTRRILEVILRKKCPIPGAFIWWKNVFITDKYEIDVTKIAGRSTSSLKAADNFVEAHKKFADYVANLRPVEVECNDDHDDEEEGERDKDSKDESKVGGACEIKEAVAAESTNTMV